MEKTSAKSTPKANSKAISIRLGSRPKAQVAGQLNHDLRRGRIPKYVDQKRLHLNDVLIEPPSPGEFERICRERRARREAERAMKSNAAVMRDGIITFGTEAQKVFEALDRDTQNRAMTAVALAIAARLKTDLVELVVHRDETAIHAHFALVAVNTEGHPISQANSQSDIGRLQDLAAEVIAEFAPSIERGHKKYDRLKAGANYADTVHRSVKQLHQDLPLEIDKKRIALAKLQKNIAAAEAKLAAGADDETKLRKRLETYNRRLSERVAELQALESKFQADLQRKVEEAEAEAKRRGDEIFEEARERGEAEGQRLIAEAKDQAAALKDDAQVFRDGILLVTTGAIKKVLKEDKPKWVPSQQLEPKMIDRFKKALRLGLGGFIDDLTSRWDAVMKLRLEKANALIGELMKLRDEMNLEQRARLDRHKAEMDDFSP